MAYFAEQEWVTDADAVLHGLRREHQPAHERVRLRGEIGRLISDRRRSLEDRTLWAMLYDIRTARTLRQLLRRTDPVFLSVGLTRNDTVPAVDVDPVSRHRRMNDPPTPERTAPLRPTC